MMSFLKGWLGEKIAQFGFWLFLGAEYKRRHDVILNTQNGTTQIDHVYLSKYGIFVVETKRMNGWIFGAEGDRLWTQKFRTGKSYTFQNPLRQNYKHVKALSEVLAVDEKYIHSVIVFIGVEARQIKTAVPQNVTVSPLMAARYIKQFTAAVFTDEELWRIENTLYGANDGQVSRQAHVDNVKGRFAQQDNCPKCGSLLTQRVTKQGANKGQAFMACSAFPKCRYIKR